jgi:hypothetical protein
VDRSNINIKNGVYDETLALYNNIRLIYTPAFQTYLLHEMMPPAREGQAPARPERGGFLLAVQPSGRHRTGS